MRVLFADRGCRGGRDAQANSGTRSFAPRMSPITARVCGRLKIVRASLVTSALVTASIECRVSSVETVRRK